jgi:hypothetical protein
MAKYLVLYRAPTSSGEQMANASPEEAQAGMELWMKWAGEAGSSLLDLGAPLSSIAMLGPGEAGQPVCGFSILEAGSKEDVKKLLADHPHFHMSGDVSIEVLEFLPIPGM